MAETGRVYTGRHATANIVINDAVLDSFWGPGGMVTDHAHDVAKDAAFYGRLQAPVRSGRLRRGIRVDPGHERRGRRHNVAYVRSRANYSFFVHQGRGPQTGLRKLSGPTPGPRSLGRWQPDGNMDWPAYSRNVGPARPINFLTEGLRFAMRGRGPTLARFR